MTEKTWALILWWAGFIMLLGLLVPTLGFTVPFVVGWWIGGPFYLSDEGEWGPFWKPFRSTKPWWREIPWNLPPRKEDSTTK